MEVAGQGHAHEVGHHAARRQQAERARPVADEVAQPAHDLLLDEGRERTGVPDVDALVRHLGEQLAHHRHRQRRRREVAELARVLRVHLAAREAGPELVEDRARPAWGRPGPGRPARAADRTRLARLRSRIGAPIARFVACVVEEVERRRPGLRPQPLERPARRAGVAVADQLGLGMPGEPGEIGLDIRRGRRIGGARRRVSTVSGIPVGSEISGGATSSDMGPGW